MRKLIILFICMLHVLSCTNNTKPSTTDILKSASKHIVKLSLISGGSGTGFYIKHYGKTYLVSNKHVCGGEDGLNSKDGYHKVIKLSKEHDLCILESRRSKGLYVGYSIIENLDEVHVIGHPVGHPTTARSGRVIKYLYDVFPWISNYPVRVIMLAVPVFGGNSGSPLLSSTGRVIGVVFATNTRTYEDSYAVPREALIRFLDKQRI